MRLSETLLLSDQIIQNISDKPRLRDQINLINILHPEHTRPSWDTYFIRIAETAATRSTCLASKRGAILVNSFKVVATGYNGTPGQLPNCSDGGCPACSLLDNSECLCIHAEINALIEAGRSRTIGSWVYTTHFPCLTCAKTMMQSQVAKITYNRQDTFNAEIADFLKRGGIEISFKSLVLN